MQIRSCEIGPARPERRRARSPKNPFLIKDFSAVLFAGSQRDHPETA
jgi:hypothetical protein